MVKAYRYVEVIGISSKSFEDAVRNGIEEAAKIGKGKLRWFEVKEERGRIEIGKIVEFQVTLKVGYTVTGG